MAKALYLITTDHGVGDNVINGIFAVLINSDNGGSDAQKRLEARAQVLAAGVVADALPTTYFDQGRILDVGDLTGGALEDDTDAAIFSVVGGGAGVITLDQND